jgi:phage-related protein
MRLLKLGQKEWTVLAVLDEHDGCSVLDLLAGAGDPGKRMLADLQVSIPERGPPLNNPEASKALRDSILEFREPTNRGGTLRVLYFYDKGRVIVCAEGLLKKRNKTPDALIDNAIKIRTQYLGAQKLGRIQIESLPGDC